MTNQINYKFVENINTNGGLSPKVSDIEFLIKNKSDNRFNEFSIWLKKIIGIDDKEVKSNYLIIVNEIFRIMNEITGDDIGLSEKHVPSWS